MVYTTYLFDFDYTLADTLTAVNPVSFPETKSVLFALKDAGARIGIISTHPRCHIQELLSRHFPDNFLDVVVSGEDVINAKTSPKGVLHAIKQLQVTKAETLYIGSNTADAEIAQTAGVDFAGVTHEATTANQLSIYPHWKIVSTLKELLEVAPPYKKKLISKWQTVLLLLISWFALVELSISHTWAFAIVFLLTLWGISQKRRVLPHKVKVLITPWWYPYKVRLHALQVKLVNGRETPPISNEPYTFQNCSTTYNGNFCNRCGQSYNTPRYRLSNALRNIAGGFTNIDNGFGRTLTELLYRPGFMIKDFIGGKRVQYFRPFQTLFVLAALYIMCVQLVDPKSLEPKQNEQEEISFTKKEIPEKVNTLATSETSITKASTNKSDQKEDLIDELVQDGSKLTQKLETYIGHSPFLMKVWNLMKSWAHGNKAFRIIATLPFFALATLLAFYRRKKKNKYNLTEHVFIQAFIACQILLLSILILPFNGKASVNDLYEVPLWFIFFLFCLDYKQLYDFNWWKSFWGTMRMFFYSLLLITLFAMLVVLLVVVVIYILRI